MRLEIIIIGFVLGVCAAAKKNSDVPPGTCRHLGLCPRTNTKFGRSRFGSGICMKTSPCEETFLPWSPCTRSCDAGIRTRFGICKAKKCKRWLRETEICNDFGCFAPPPPPPPPGPGGWSNWGEWSSFGACDRSCCGGTQTRTRTRTCPTSGCSGNATETESQPCNTEICPVSCVGITSLTFFNNPCEACSRTYYVCSGNGETTATQLECTDPSQTWNQAAQECQFDCAV